MTIKTYSELIQIPEFIDRYYYLQMKSELGKATFGFDRYLNQQFYKSREWRAVRAHVIIRDLGCDLGIKDREITGCIIIHHLNPLCIDDLKNRTKFLLDPEYLISTQHNTHNAIHFGDESLLISNIPIERSPNDTKLW